MSIYDIVMENSIEQNGLEQLVSTLEYKLDDTIKDITRLRRLLTRLTYGVEPTCLVNDGLDISAMGAKLAKLEGERDAFNYSLIKAKLALDGYRGSALKEDYHNKEVMK